MPGPKSLSDRLKEVMDTCGWSCRSLAKASRVDHSTISRILRGQMPTYTTLEKLSNALGVRYSWLLTGDKKT